MYLEPGVPLITDVLKVKEGSGPWEGVKHKRSHGSISEKRKALLGESIPLYCIMQIVTILFLAEPGD